MSAISVRVVAAEAIAEGIRRLRLVPCDAAALPTWEPGSHIDLHLGEDMIRQYSLCGSLADTSAYEVAVKLEPESRGGSKFVHSSLSEGCELTISAPRNHFRVEYGATRSVLMAGGIGITPIISMARLLYQREQRFDLLYFCRSEAHAAFRDELTAGVLGERCRMLFGLDRGAVEATLGQALRDWVPGCHLYLCGPQPFMDTVRAVAKSLGWPEEAVHLEYFAGTATPPAAESTTSFELTLARSGRTLAIPAEKTIVDVLREEGIEIDTSCEQGVCGTCVVQVLEGQPDHQDCFLTAQEKARGDCMAVCVSRSRSKSLVVDL
ncbi:ferredoxin [Pandoraea thiooxydans]|uniref:Ferredoxin n=1 Tax=Pandoraea thiooxydans TaxID=445709 RepID=A0A0G3EIZ0_9BURK|nr:PDR/VanB family oxidoreductase [Pandoraea thiooxydans]AKJ66973.1 ferredoxin [Pandoraea thiooxydans]APR93875.1 ferredoxin [Pandoraea thiooxydans]